MGVKDILKKYDLTQQEMADFIGVQRARLAVWAKKNIDTPPFVDAAKNYSLAVKTFANMPVERVASFVKTHRIILGNIEPIDRYSETIATGFVAETETPYNETKGTLVPYYDIDIIAGTQMLYDDHPSTTPSYYLDIPEFAGCKAFPVYSDSMAPLITPGSTIFIRPIHNWRDVLEYGQIYTVQLSDLRRFIKYLRKSTNNDNFTARSHNAEYDDFEIPKKLIAHIAIVEGWMLKKTQ